MQILKIYLVPAIFNKINNYWDLIIWPKIISNVANIRLLLEDINNLNNFIMFVFQKEGLNMFNPKIVAPIFFQYWFLRWVSSLLRIFIRNLFTNYQYNFKYNFTNSKLLFYHYFCVSILVIRNRRYLGPN